MTFLSISSPFWNLDQQQKQLHSTSFKHCQWTNSSQLRFQSFQTSKMHYAIKPACWLKFLTHKVNLFAADSCTKNSLFRSIDLRVFSFQFLTLGNLQCRAAIILRLFVSLCDCGRPIIIWVVYSGRPVGRHRIYFTAHFRASKELLCLIFSGGI